MLMAGTVTRLRDVAAALVSTAVSMAGVDSTLVTTSVEYAYIRTSPSPVATARASNAALCAPTVTLVVSYVSRRLRRMRG